MKLGTKEYDVHTLEGAEDEDGEKKVQVEMVIPEDKMRVIIESHWGELVGGFKEQLKEQIEMTKIWLKEIQEFVDHKGEKTDQKVEGLEEKVGKYQTNSQLEINVLKGELDGVINNVEKLKVNNTE